MESLLRDFVPEDFINELDFTTLEQAASNYITEEFKERHNDIIWRVRWKDAWCYIFLMTESQSSQHYWMALRMLAYTALLWENLIRIGYLKTGDKLPPVFPIVLYNGDSPWKAETDISALIASVAPTLDAYQPEYKYYVLDEKRIGAEIIARAKGAAGYIVKAEQARSREQIIKIAVDFDSRDGIAKAEDTHLAMLEWMNKKLKHLPPDSDQGNLSASWEESMLVELIEKYKRPYIEAGYAEGMAEGIEIGEARAEARGMLSIVRDMLSEKFGPIPAGWDASLKNLKEPAQLCQPPGL